MEIKINKDLLKAASKFHFRRYMESGNEECLKAYMETAFKLAIITKAILLPDMRLNYSRFIKGL